MQRYIRIKCKTGSAQLIGADVACTADEATLTVQSHSRSSISVPINLKYIVHRCDNTCHYRRYMMTVGKPLHCIAAMVS